MGKFADNIFSEVRSVNINELIEKEQDLEIICKNFKQQDALSMINNNYRILIMKSTQHTNQKSQEINRQLMLDVCSEYERTIDFFPKIYEDTVGFAPIDESFISTYHIGLNPKNHIRSLLNFIISIDNIGTLANSTSIYVHNKKLNTYFDSQISPNGELISYMKDLKFGDMPFDYYPNQKEFMHTITLMNQIVESCICSMIDVYDDYDYIYVITEIRKWLRASKKTWIAGQIEDRKITYEEYKNIARKYYESRRFVYPNR